MATATKNARSLIVSQSLAAAAAAVTGSLDLHTALGCLLTVRITNGATGPTVGATVTVSVSTDNSTWRTFMTAVQNLGNNVITDLMVSLPPETMYVQVSIGGNTAQAITIEALAHELTSIA